MDIGEVERVIQVEPTALPVPEVLPMPVEEPIREPDPAPTARWAS